MIGVSSLNLDNKFVYIMEQEFRDTRHTLVLFTRKVIINMIIIAILNIISAIISFDFIEHIFLLSFSEIFIWRILKKTAKETNLRHVDEIVFGEDYNIYKINEEDVYNTTRTLCRMRGVINGYDKLINCVLITHILITISSIAQFILDKLVFV